MAQKIIGRKQESKELLDLYKENVLYVKKLSPLGWLN